MSVRNYVADRRVPSEHLVRFFDTDNSRAQAVARFLAAGYRLREPLIVIARTAVYQAIHEQLGKLGVPVDRAIADKQLIVREAGPTLNKLSAHSRPSASLFENVIGTMVRTTGRAGTVRAYGEMVDMLAERSEFECALELEELWNNLARVVPVKLLCGYCSAHFVSTGTRGTLGSICRAHDRVEMDDQDQLGTWLLGTAGIAAPRS